MPRSSQVGYDFQRALYWTLKNLLEESSPHSAGMWPHGHHSASNKVLWKAQHSEGIRKGVVAGV